MTKRAKMAYVPPIIIEELQDIMEEENILIKADGYRELAKYSKVGREMKRIMNLDFRRKPKKQHNNFKEGFF